MAQVTMIQLARAAGVSATTVSLALRNHPRIPAATRDRIQSLARELGYRPDPRVAELMAHLRSSGQRQGFEVLAFVNTFVEPKLLHSIENFALYLAGARQRATELGYGIEEFILRERGMTGRRLSQILVNRGIRGVLVGPTMRKTHLRLDWDHFSSVVIGHTHYHPRLHGVANNQYHSMSLALRHLRRLGYRRIGLLLDEEIEKMHDYNYVAAFRQFAALDPKLTLRALVIPQPTRAQFSAWLRRNRPEIVIGLGAQALHWLRELDHVVPDTIGFVDLCQEPSTPLAGVDQNSRDIGARAVEQLLSLMHRHEQGIPSCPTNLLLEGQWRLGNTVRSLHGSQR